MADVRFGLIGFGAWGSHHARALAQAPGAKLLAIAGRSDSSQAAAREAFPQVDVVGDYRQLLARKDIDAVDVVLPSYLHAEVGEAVLRSGKHLLLEKPMTCTLADCDRLLALAAEHNKQIVIGHELRLSSLWGKAKELVDAGAIGTPQYALVELSRRPYRPGAGGWRYDIERVGNWILEEPIHFFDLARWYLSSAGEPTRVFARANSRQPEHPELQDNFSAMLEFPGGAYAVVTQTLSAFEHHQTVKLTGTEGALWASWSGAMDRTLHPTFWLKKHRLGDDDAEQVPLAAPSGEVFELEAQAARMVQVVRGAAEPHATGLDGRWSVAMCLAAAESVNTGQPVELKRFGPSGS